MKLYKLDVANIPDELFNKETDVKKWLELTTTSKDTFPPNSLNKVSPIANDVHIERILGIHLYMLGNILPFVLPILSVAALFSDIGMLCLKAFLSYFSFLYAVIHYYYFPYFQVKYKRQRELSNDIRDNQYLHTERNTAKYCSTQFVWSETIQRPALDGTPVIFCAIPHGAAPLGITSYPVWSKIFNDKICHWTCAPIVLKLPLISSFMKKIGYIPAKANMIVQTLTKKEENVGIILDGISGMFQGSNEERAYIQQRKGIVKIALRAGAPLVPGTLQGMIVVYIMIIISLSSLLQKLSNLSSNALLFYIFF